MGLCRLGLGSRPHRHSSRHRLSRVITMGMVDHENARFSALHYSIYAPRARLHSILCRGLAVSGDLVGDMGSFSPASFWHFLACDLKRDHNPPSCIRARLLSDAQQETGRASSWFSTPILSPSSFACTLVVAWIAARISYAVLIAVDAAARVERAC